MKKIIIPVLIIGLVGGIGYSVFGADEKVTYQELEIAGEKVIIGGEEFGATEQKFKPEVKLQKWGDETHIRVWSDDEGDDKATRKGDKLVWKTKDNKKEYNFYEIDNGFEYEIILLEKPDSNVITLNIELQDLKCYYQPELTQKEKDEGFFRPENVIGSYACYHSYKKNHIIGQTNYKTGKAFHIYRPQMVDDNGDKIWGEMEIKGNKLSVTIPQEFLDKAIYPIIVDPTFGVEDMGGSAIGLASEIGGEYYSNRKGDTHSLSVAGTLDKVTIGLKKTAGDNDIDIWTFLCREDSGGSGSHGEVFSLERANLELTDTGAYYDFTASNEELSIDDYVIGVLGNAGDQAQYDDTYLMYDNGSGSRNTYSEQAAGGQTGYDALKGEDPWTEAATVTETAYFSMYVTYEPSVTDGTERAIIKGGGTLEIKGGGTLKIK